MTPKFTNNVDFHCKICLEGGLIVYSVLFREVEIELDVKVECLSKLCYLGDTLGGGCGGAARASERGLG